MTEVAKLNRKAIYPGSFDPLTNGHLDIIRRAAPMFDELIVAVSDNVSKSALFSIDERMGFVSGEIKDLENVSVRSFNTLLVDYIRKNDIHVIIRGLRAMTDFEMEFQMALINKSLYPEAETIFLVTNTDYSFIRSSAIKEVACYGGDVTQYVPGAVNKAMAAKFGGAKS